MRKISHVENIIGVLILTLIISVTGCKSFTKKKDAEETQVTKPLMKKAIEQEVKKVVYPLPTPFELTSMLNRIGASYILNLSNSVDNADKYFTEKSRALNLGVYSADLSYASTYQRKQETMLYLNVSKKLIDDLEITGTYSETLIEDVEKSLDRKDELVKIITNSFHSTYEFLNKNGKANLSLMMVSGSFIEGLYIATHISKNTFNNPEIVQIIFDQKKALDRLVEILEPEKEDANIAYLLKELTNLKQSYDAIESSMTKAQLNTITASIEKLREVIIQ